MISSPPTNYANPCHSIRAKAISPVLLNNSGECYITLTDLNGITPNRQLRVLDEAGKSYPFRFYGKDKTYYHVKNLPLNKSYAVEYTNDCDQQVELGSFTTGFKSGNNIYVSQALYEVIADISINKDKHQNSYESILRNADVDDFEKAYFFQRYFLKGAPVKNHLDLLDPFSMSDKTEKRMCNCERVIHTFTINPGILNNKLGAILGEQEQEDDANKLEYNLHTAGAAKSWRAYSDGGRETRNRTYGGAVGNGGAAATNLRDLERLPNDFSNVARINMNLFCNGGATPRDCGCTKLVQGRVMYESQLSVRSQTGGGGGTKNAFAAGEDIAIAYELKRDGTPGGEYTFLGGLMNTARDSCGRQPNPQFWSSVTGAALGFATFIASLSTGSDTSTAAFIAARLQLISQISEDVEGIVANPSTLNSGECSVQFQRVNPVRLDLEYRTDLEPNIPTAMGIATRTRLVSTGMRSWQSEVLLSTGFSLATAHPAGLAFSNDDPGCCIARSEAIFMSYAHTPNLIELFPPPSSPVSPLLDLRVDAAEFLFRRLGSWLNFPQDERGRYYTPFVFGSALASRRFDEGACELLPGVPDFPSPGEPDMPELTGKPGSSNNKFSTDSYERLTYQLYTMDGRSLGTIQATTADFQLRAIQNLRQRGLPAAVYLIRGFDEQTNSPITKRIHLNKIR
jgi:hypothetical protein